MIESFAKQLKKRLEYVPDGNVYVMFSPYGALKLAAEIDRLLDEKSERICLCPVGKKDMVFKPKIRKNKDCYLVKKL